MECSEEEAFKNSVESITGPITRIISREGMPAVYEALDAEGKKTFEKVLPLNIFRLHVPSMHAAYPFKLARFEVPSQDCFG